MDHPDDPGAISWAEMKDELEFTPDEQAEIKTQSQELIAQARAFRIAKAFRRTEPRPPR
jgi:hypothetical protein